MFVKNILSLLATSYWSVLNCHFLLNLFCYSSFFFGSKVFLQSHTLVERLRSDIHKDSALFDDKLKLGTVVGWYVLRRF